jgi:lipopolysaccharide export LptBFGC system permease protein LptF
LVLPVSWDNFLLLTNIRRGLSGLTLVDLRRAAENLGTYGHQGQVFEAELLRRFTEPLLLLPLGIAAIVAGWRFRALKRPRYMGIPMLLILPVVFTGVEHFVRHWVNNLGIWAVVSFGFTFAAVFFGIGVLVLLILSLIALAAQHS